MKTRSVQIISRKDGQNLSAELLVCSDCQARLFIVYIPDGMSHVHFQCYTCGQSFCDGCEDTQQTSGRAN